MIVTLPIALLPRVRRRRDFLPRWYLGKVFIQVAALPVLLLLLVLALAAWLLEWPDLPSLANALIILLLANALLAVWSHFGLQLHRLLKGPSPPAPPPEARSPLPPP